MQLQFQLSFHYTASFALVVIHFFNNDKCQTLFPGLKVHAYFQSEPMSLDFSDKKLKKKNTNNSLIDSNLIINAQHGIQITD